MPKTGDSYEAILSETHISWGEVRRTDTRRPIAGENFIPIPISEARRIGIFDKKSGEGIGNNEFNATSADGFYQGVVKVSGYSPSDPIYAKNIAESGNLKGFSDWFEKAEFYPGTRVKVEWVSDTEILFTKLN